MLGVSGGTAVLRFASAEAAERARKRMENEDVLGNRITVSFSPDGIQEEEEVERPRPAASSSIPTALFLPVEKPRSPRRPRRALRASQSCKDAGVNVPERPYSPRKVGHASSCSPVLKSLSQVSGVTAYILHSSFSRYDAYIEPAFRPKNILSPQVQDFPTNLRFPQFFELACQVLLTKQKPSTNNQLTDDQNCICWRILRQCARV